MGLPKKTPETPKDAPQDLPPEAEVMAQTRGMLDELKTQIQEENPDARQAGSTPV